MTEPILALESVSKRFVKPLDLASRAANLFGAGLHEAVVHAVDGVRLAIDEGEVVGLVGESGCGKSTLGRIAAGLLPPSDGRVRFRGVAIDELDAAACARRQAQAADDLPGPDGVAQSAHARYRPRRRGAGRARHCRRPRSRTTSTRADAPVGLDPSYRSRYPHQFSGGQRARIGIARALAVQPDFLVCDEPVAALDVSIQAQVLNLFIALRDELRLTYLFISHDLGVVEHLSDRVVIMYLGRVVEIASTEELFRQPNHPYTQALLANAPRVEAGRQRFTPIAGEIPSPFAPPSGCHFHPRCPFAMPRCRTERPMLTEIAPEHFSACHLNQGR